jgi:hypothetical protein
MIINILNESWTQGRGQKQPFGQATRQKIPAGRRRESIC